MLSIYNVLLPVRRVVVARRGFLHVRHGGIGSLVGGMRELDHRTLAIWWIVAVGTHTCGVRPFSRRVGF